MPTTARLGPLVLADDATGALECGSLLAAYGTPVVFSVGNAIPAPSPGGAVLVADTESRHLLAAQAAQAIHAIVAASGASPRTPVFKKTDSTLRGNIAAEFAALLQVWPERPIVYIPAYPAFGRTVRGGQLWVHGKPLAETEFAFDIREPIHSSRVDALFPAALKPHLHLVPGPGELRESLTLAPGGIHICDAADDSGIGSLIDCVCRTQPDAIIAGPAGVMPYWTGMHDLPTSAPAPIPRPASWLIIRGSRHPQSLRQTAHARSLGLPVVESPSEPGASPGQVAAALGRDAAEAIGRLRPSGLVVLGGDTVIALWQALGLPAVRPLPELLTGVAMHLLPEKDLLVVTKAGGFGDDSLIEKILEQFS